MFHFTSSHESKAVRFEDNKIYIDDIPFKVVEDKKKEFVYLIQRTQIKAIDGIKGLEKLIEEDTHKILGAGFGGCFVDRLANAYSKGKIKAAKK